MDETQHAAMPPGPPPQQPRGLPYGPPPPPPRRSTSTPWIVGGGVLTVVAAFGLGAGVGYAAHDGSNSTVASASTSPSTNSPLAADRFPSSSPSPSPTATYQPTASDFKLSVKILSKSCFGSAGCNITYRIQPSYVALETPSDKVEVTYQVTGDESGPKINTFTMDPDGTAHFDEEEIASTSSSSTTLTAKVTDVSTSY